MTGESIGRALRGKQGLSAESAVRLAVLNDEDPLNALDEAGHGEFADLLRGYFEPNGAKPLTKKQREIIDALEAMETDDRKHLLALARSLGKKGSKR